MVVSFWKADSRDGRCVIRVAVTRPHRTTVYRARNVTKGERSMWVKGVGIQTHFPQQTSQPRTTVIRVRTNGRCAYDLAAK